MASAHIHVRFDFEILLAVASVGGLALLGLVLVFGFTRLYRERPPELPDVPL